MHAPAVALDQLAHDRKPQAEAPIGPRLGSVALLEGREDAVEEGGCNAVAGVPDDEPHLVPRALESGRDAPPRV